MANRLLSVSVSMMPSDRYRTHMIRLRWNEAYRVNVKGLAQPGKKKMDLAGMINDGAEALHRGSVDKTSNTPSTPVLNPGSPEAGSDSAGSFQKESAIVDDKKGSSPSPPKNKISQSVYDIRGRSGPPPWARIYRGRGNRVRDVRRWQLADTRPELGNLFDDSPGEPEKENKELVSPRNDTKALPSTPFRPVPIPATRPSEIGPGGNLSLTGLAASLAALIPNDDQTRVLAGWLFEQIEHIPTDLLNCVEVEFKMGQIATSSNVRHKFPIMSEGVVDPTYWRVNNLRFQTAIDETSFRSLESVLDSLEMANSANEQNTITKSNQLITDDVYHIKMPNGMKKRVRVSRDERGRVVECIDKNRINDLFISLPNSPFDLKVSVSTEEPVDYEQAVAPQLSSTRSSHERNKNRLKYVSRGCTVDLTSVHSQGAQQAQMVKEGEIEANMELLGTVLQEYRNLPNKAESLDKFLEVVRYTMDSARFLLRNI